MGDDDNDIISPDGHYRWNGEEWELIDIVKTLERISQETSETLNEEFQTNEPNQETETITQESISLSESESSHGILGDFVNKLLSKEKTALKFILLNWWGCLVLILICFNVISIGAVYSDPWDPFEVVFYFGSERCAWDSTPCFENLDIFSMNYTFRIFVFISLFMYLISFYLNVYSLAEGSHPSKVNLNFSIAGNLMLIFSALYYYNSNILDRIEITTGWSSFNFRPMIGIHLLLLTGIYSLVYNLIFWKHTKENPII